MGSAVPWKAMTGTGPAHGRSRYSAATRPTAAMRSAGSQATIVENSDPREMPAA
jgi:hypothetical protein